MNNQDNEKVFQKSNINWLACIYADTFYNNSKEVKV